MDITPTTLRRYFKVLLILAALSQLHACGGASTASTAPVDTQLASYQITVTPGIGGDATPSTQSVSAGNTATISINPDPGYSIDSLSGCIGTLEDTVFTVESVIDSCSLVIEFIRNVYDVNVTTNNGGNVEFDSFQVEHGNTLDVTIVPENDFYIASISGCEGVLESFVYTTLPVEQACDIEITFQGREYIQGDLDLSLDYGENRVFYFSWTSESDWQEYRLYEDERGTSDFQEIAVVNGDSNTFSLNVPLHLKTDALYKLEACSERECTVSNVVQAYNHIVDAVETLAIPDNVEACEDAFYRKEMAISADGLWMAVYTNEYLCEVSGPESVVMYHKTDHQWQYHSHIDMEFDFQYTVFTNRSRRPMALSGDGKRLGIGVIENAIDSEGKDKYLGRKIYVYKMLEGEWQVEDVLEAPWRNNSSYELHYLAFSYDGMTLAYSGGYDAYHPCFIFSPCFQSYEDSFEFESEGNIFVHKYKEGYWSKAAIIKSIATRRKDWFGYSFDLSANGNRLVVGAPTQNYDASYSDNKIDSEKGVGSVYIFDYDDFWSVSKIIKPDLDSKGDLSHFGSYVSMSSSGNQFLVSVEKQSLMHQFSYQQIFVHEPYFYYRGDNQWKESVVTNVDFNFGRYTINNATLSGDGKIMAARVDGVSSCENLFSDAIDDAAEDIDSHGVVVFFQKENNQWKYRNCLNSSIEHTKIYPALYEVNGDRYDNIGFGFNIFLDDQGISFLSQGGLSPWELEYDYDIYPIYIY